MMTDLRTDLPELFDLDYGDFAGDLPFYENLARRSDGPILELGIGTGRIAVPLARAGYEVWGIDSSEAVLARARCKAGAPLVERLHLLPGDMRDFQLDRQFDLVFAGLGTFHHLLTTDDQLACLRCVERHLTPGGLFVCDLRPLFPNEWQSGDSVPLLHDWTRVLPSTGETVIKLRSVRADRAAQVQHELHIYDIVSNDGAVRRVTAEVDLRFSTRYEMEGLLREAGLKLDQVYGDFDLAPYDEASEYMITVVRKPLGQPS
jgi:SAM-dependent methyltransferase